MAVVEQYTSPDGLLELFVDLTAGDWTVGFRGYPYHTHGDILAATGHGPSPEAAVRHFVEEIIQSRCMIVVSRVNGKIRDFAVPNAQEASLDFLKYALPGETIEKRYWNGVKVVE